MGNFIIKELTDQGWYSKMILPIKLIDVRNGEKEDEDEPRP